MRILQIGDIHFDNRLSKTEKDKRNNCFEEMFDFLEQSIIEHPVDYLVLSGDIAYHGTPDEYEEAYTFIIDLLSKLNLDVSKLVMCPGNHDLDRTEIKEIDIPETPVAIEDRYSFESLKRISRPFENYISFCEKLGATPATCRKDGLSSYLIGVISFSDIQFLVLNSAWAAKDDDHNNKMFLGSNFIESIIAEKLIDPDKFTMTVVHHPLSSLIDFERGNYRGSTNTFRKVQKLSDITVCGHTHEMQLSISTEYGTPLAISGAAFIDNHYPNCVSVYNINKNVIQPVCYQYNEANDPEKWQPKYYTEIFIDIPYEKAKRELSSLLKRILKYKERLSYKALSSLKTANLNNYFASLLNRRNGMLSSYDKALLLLYCEDNVVRDIFNKHYPCADKKGLRDFVDEVTQIPEYQDICTAISFAQLLGDEWLSIYNYIHSRSPIYYKNSIWGEITNENFRKNLCLQTNTKITQIKLMGSKYKLMRNVFSSVHKVVSEMHIFLASPYLFRDTTMVNLDSCYDAPVFLKAEYLSDGENSYSIDRIRRTLLIYFNIKHFTELSTSFNIPITVYFFTEEYPGFTYQSIQESGFAHLFPDCLPLSKPKFRFAIEINDISIVDLIEKTLFKRISSKEIPLEKMELSVESFELFKNALQKDLKQYFLRENIELCSFDKHMLYLADTVEVDTDTVHKFLEECYV